MIQLFDRQVNQSVLITTKVSTTTEPNDMVLIKDGAANATVVTFTNLSTTGLANFSFTPTSTGVYTLYGDGQVLATVEVVTRTDKSFLQNLEDEALGSWQWDKAAGTLQMLKQDGTPLANFTVVDNLTASSRERI